MFAVGISDIFVCSFICSHHDICQSYQLKIKKEKRMGYIKDGVGGVGWGGGGGERSSLLSIESNFI